MLRKLIPIMLSALLLSVSGCGKSAENDNITVMKPPSNTTTENTGSQESVQSDDEEITSDEEPITEENVNETDESEEPVYDGAADIFSDEETEEPFAGYVKCTYDPWEFIDGVERVIQNSDTIEEMYQALEEFDTEGRIDRVVISFRGKPVTEGRLVDGMWGEVYYDNEESWFNFKY